jgi:hypothetical protein
MFAYAFKTLICYTGSDIQTGCGFLVYAQIEHSKISEEVMHDLEDELQKPTGKWTVDRPPLRVNGVLMSRECGLLYRLHDAEGLRYVRQRWSIS